MTIQYDTPVRSCGCSGCTTQALKGEMVCLEHWTQYRINALLGETPADRERREEARQERIRRFNGHM